MSKLYDDWDEKTCLRYNERYSRILKIPVTYIPCILGFEKIKNNSFEVYKTCLQITNFEWLIRTHRSRDNKQQYKGLRLSGPIATNPMK